MRNLFITATILIYSFCGGQVGINTSAPKASLQIDAKNTLTPESTAGFGIPAVNRFPVNNPSSLQNGMLIYLQNNFDNNLKGYYYWDAAVSNWTYIVDSETQLFDLSKVIVTGNAFYPSNITGANAGTRQVPLNSIISVLPGFSLTSNGELKVGETSTYYLVFTGGITKQAGGVVNDVATSILINGVESASLSSANSIPAGAGNNRGATFYIATIIQLNKNDLISIQTTKDSAQDTTTLYVSTPYTINLINLK